MAEMKLNIYDKKNVVKTYTAETYDIMFGTVEDLIDLIDFENVDLDDNKSLVSVAGKVVMGGMDIIKPLYKDIFDGLTDEELRHTHLSELAAVLISVIKFTITQISKGGNSKTNSGKHECFPLSDSVRTASEPV